jgi:indole-3-glycerol phosphate synthase
MNLEIIAAASRRRVEEAKRTVPPEEIQRLTQAAAGAAELNTCSACRTDDGFNGAAGAFPFEAALRAPDISFICEVKKASPSKGVIAENFPYLEIAADYEAAGAAAISVLTEPEFFMGSSQYLCEIRQRVKLPLLRKDFIVDEYQLYEAKLMGADAALLICALLDGDTLKRYIALCHRLGLSALVEAHDEAEVNAALTAGARIIGVNNRDLKTFEVNFDTCVRLRPLVPREILFVAESGIKTAEDIRMLREIGADAALIGETLMRSADKKAALAKLRGEI